MELFFDRLTESDIRDLAERVKKAGKKTIFIIHYQYHEKKGLCIKPEYGDYKKRIEQIMKRNVKLPVFLFAPEPDDLKCLVNMNTNTLFVMVNAP